LGAYWGCIGGVVSAKITPLRALSGGKMPPCETEKRGVIGGYYPPYTPPLLPPNYPQRGTRFCASVMRCPIGTPFLPTPHAVAAHGLYCAPYEAANCSPTLRPRPPRKPPSAPPKAAHGLPESLPARPQRPPTASPKASQRAPKGRPKSSQGATPPLPLRSRSAPPIGAAARIRWRGFDTPTSRPSDRLIPEHLGSHIRHKDTQKW
jgi:hypothetical protein